MPYTHIIQAILADIDGTISPAKGRPRDLFQLQRLRRFCDLAEANAVPAFGFATGRNRSYVEALLQTLGIPKRIPHIVENGCALYLADKDELIAHPKSALFGEAKHAIAEIIQGISHDMGCIEDREKIFMFTLYPGAGSVSDLYELVAMRLAQFNDIVDVAYSSSSVDVMPKGINKGSGLAFFCEYTGVPAEQILAIGDSNNDATMLALAGFAACPGNATDEIQKLVAEKGLQQKGYIARSSTTAGVVRILEHFFELDLPDPRLRKLSVEEALRRKQEVTCALVPGEDVQYDRKYLDVIIPDDPYIANTREQMAAISGPSNGNHYRWAAGGIAPIIATSEGDYLVTLYRDKDAFTWPNTLTIPTGLSADSSEFLDVLRTIFREGFEEILIRTPNGLLAPEGIGISNEIDVESIVANGLHLATRYWDLPLALDWQPASVITTAHDIPVSVSWRNKKRIFRSLVTLHEVTSGIDLVKIVRIQVPYSITELQFADGEEGSHHDPLNRNVYLIPKAEVVRWTQTGGTINASHHFLSGKSLGSKALEGIKPLPFLEDAMRAIATL